MPIAAASGASAAASAEMDLGDEALDLARERPQHEPVAIAELDHLHAELRRRRVVALEPAHDRRAGPLT